MLPRSSMPPVHCGKFNSSNYPTTMCVRIFTRSIWADQCCHVVPMVIWPIITGSSPAFVCIIDALVEGSYGKKSEISEWSFLNLSANSASHSWRDVTMDARNIAALPEWHKTTQRMIQNATLVKWWADELLLPFYSNLSQKHSTFNRLTAIEKYKLIRMPEAQIYTQEV